MDRDFGYYSEFWTLLRDDKIVWRWETSYRARTVATGEAPALLDAASAAMAAMFTHDAGRQGVARNGI